MTNPAIEKERYRKHTEILLMVLVIGWIVFITAAAQLMAWLMEQSLFESSLLFPDIRWLIQLAYCALISLPLFMLAFILQNPRQQIILRFWAILGLSGVFLIAGRFLFISRANWVSISQIAGLWVFFFLFTILTKKAGRPSAGAWKTEKPALGLVLGLLALLAIPWLLWGALGSITDTLLNLAAGLSLAFVFVHIFSRAFAAKLTELTEDQLPNYFFTGLIIFTGLLILCTNFGQNGQQWMLIFTLPLASWLAVGFIGYEPKRCQPALMAVLLGLLAAMPLCWFDPDELALVVGAQNGEILSWVGRAVLATSTMLVILTPVAKRILRQGAWVKKMARIAAVLWVLAAIIYVFLGQPGLFGESYIVVMEQSADLSVIQSAAYPQRKNGIYAELTEFSAASQQNVRNVLERWQVEYQPYYLVNAIEVRSGPLLRFYLTRMEGVERILESPNLRPLPKALSASKGDLHSPPADLWNLEAIEVYRAWETFGAKGAGVVIGLADSGADGTHPQIRSQFRGNQNPGAAAWLDPWNVTTAPVDLNGHGTHTLGIILGKDTGVAPEAEWIGCVNLARNLGNPGFYLECMQFLFAPYPPEGDPFRDGRPDLGADIINNSWGCPPVEGCDAEIFLDAVSALQKAGVLMVAANGNTGYAGCESTLAPPATYGEVLSVGAIDETGALAGFSSLGPVLSSEGVLVKPDLAAPGVDILSAMPDGSYAAASGTSSASPHVAGVAALMWSANPLLKGNVDATRQILFQTASSLTGSLPFCVAEGAFPNNAVGYGVVNAFKAVEAALDFK